MSEEDIAASDLGAAIAKKEQGNQKIKRENEAEVNFIKENISSLMEAYKEFQTNIDKERKKVADRFAKLNSK